jgi:hypothetical protein
MKKITQKLEKTKRRERPLEERNNSKGGRDETKRKAQERMEGRSRKRSSSAGSKMERVGDR